MSKNITSILLVASVVLVSACTSRINSDAQQTVTEEFIIMEPEPITVEPTYTGKFK